MSDEPVDVPSDGEGEPRPTAFGQLFIDARNRRQLPLRSVCRQLGLDPSYYCRLENGRRRYLPASRWSAASAALELPLLDILGAAIRSGYVAFDPAALPAAAITAMQRWALAHPSAELRELLEKQPQEVIERFWEGCFLDATEAREACLSDR